MRVSLCPTLRTPPALGDELSAHYGGSEAPEFGVVENELHEPEAQKDKEQLSSVLKQMTGALETSAKLLEERSVLDSYTAQPVSSRKPSVASTAGEPAGEPEAPPMNEMLEPPAADAPEFVVVGNELDEPEAAETGESVTGSLIKSAAQVVGTPKSMSAITLVDEPQSTGVNVSMPAANVAACSAKTRKLGFPLDLVKTDAISQHDDRCPVGKCVQESSGKCKEITPFGELTYNLSEGRPKPGHVKWLVHRCKVTDGQPVPLGLNSWVHAGARYYDFVSDPAAVTKRIVHRNLFYNSCIRTLQSNAPTTPDCAEMMQGSIDNCPVGACLRDKYGYCNLHYPNTLKFLQVPLHGSEFHLCNIERNCAFVFICQMEVKCSAPHGIGSYVNAKSFVTGMGDAPEWRFYEYVPPQLHLFSRCVYLSVVIECFFHLINLFVASGLLC